MFDTVNNKEILPFKLYYIYNILCFFRFLGRFFQYFVDFKKIWRNILFEKHYLLVC